MIRKSEYATSSGVHGKLPHTRTCLRYHERPYSSTRALYLISSGQGQTWPPPAPSGAVMSENHDKYRGTPEKKLVVDLSPLGNSPVREHHLPLASIPLDEESYSKLLDPYVSVTKLSYSTKEPTLGSVTTYWSQQNYSPIKGTRRPRPSELPLLPANLSRVYGGENFLIDKNTHNQAHWAPTTFVTQNRKTYAHPQVLSRLAAKFKGKGGVHWGCNVTNY